MIFKVKNIFFLMLGYFFSILTKKPICNALPIFISIEPVNYCNLHCVECPSGRGELSREKKMLTPEAFLKIIDAVKSHVIYLTLYFQGEPFLNSSFLDFVSLARKNKIYTVSSTNAQLITDEIAEKTVRSGLNKLIVSIDGTTQETYEKYRVGGSLEKTKQSVRLLTEWKRKLKSSSPVLEMQFLVFRHNEHQMQEAKRLAKELGVDKLVFKTAQILHFEDGSELLPTQEKYSRYKKQKGGNYIRKKKVRNHCWRAFSSVVIAANGDVLPCSYDKNGEFAFGNINEESFPDIWKNEKSKAFKKQILTNRGEFPMCCNCTE